MTSANSHSGNMAGATTATGNTERMANGRNKPTGVTPDDRKNVRARIT